MELQPEIEKTERAPFDDDMTSDDEEYPDFDIENDPMGSNETGKKGGNEPAEKLHGVKSADTDTERNYDEEIEDDIM